MGAALVVYTPAFLTFVVAGLAPPTPAALGMLLLTGLTEGAYLILLTYTYRHADLSLVYPVSRGSAPLVIVLVGAVFLAERISWMGAAGIALTTAGIVFCSWPARGTRIAARPIMLSLLVGAAIAAHTIGYKWLFRFWPPHATIYLVWLVTAAVLGTYAVITRPRGRTLSFIQVNIPRASLMGVMAMAGFLLALFALDLSLASYMGAARNVGVIFGVFIGAHVLKEGGLALRITGGVAITAGVVLLAFA